MPSLSTEVFCIVIIGGDSRVMVIEYLRRETYGVVVGVARRPFDDFTHFRPSVLCAFPGINLPHPLHTAARDGGADTRCNRADGV